MLPYSVRNVKEDVMVAVSAGSEWFTMAQTARILGVQRQAVYDAIVNGRMRATGAGWDRRINVEDIVAYTVKTGRDLTQVIERIQSEAAREGQGEISNKTILGWVIAAIGVAWLLKNLD